MSPPSARPLPGCLSFLHRSLTEIDVLELAASAGAHFSFHPELSFTGPPCRADWHFPAPEVVFEKGLPDLRSNLFSLGVTLLAAGPGDGVDVPSSPSVEYAQWTLDGSPASIWRAQDWLQPEVKELFAQCVDRARKHRPGSSEQLRALLLAVWPEDRTDAFPTFFLRAPKLSAPAWIAAARALPWWQVAGLVITLGLLIAWLRLNTR